MSDWIEKFYAFMMERDAIRVRRAQGLPRDQWTRDPIFSAYKFTNVKREHDRTTRELVRDFYKDNLQRTNRNTLLMNCGLARYFSWAPTVIEIGYQDHWDERAQNHVRSVIERRKLRGEKIFTGAFTIPNCGDPRDKIEVVLEIVQEIQNITEVGNPLDRFEDFQSINKEMSSRIRGMGSFMCKEVVLDYILVSGWRPSDWATWTPMGPGGRRGAKRVFNKGVLGSVPSEKIALEWTRQIYDRREEFWHGDDLDLCDIQFQLCEFDKYMRVDEASGRPRARFHPTAG